MTYSQVHVLKEIAGYSVNLLIGFSGWAVVLASIRAGKKLDNNPLVKFIENIGMLIGFFLPALFISMLRKLPYNDNPLNWAEYGGIAMAIGWTSPFILLLVRLSQSSSFSKKRTNAIKDKSKGERKTVSFAGEKGEYKVEFIGMEVYADPENKEMVGAGDKFEDNFLEEVSFGASFNGPDKALIGLKCVKCKKKVGEKDVSVSSLEAKYSFKGMKPFVKRVIGPMYVCPECGYKMIANYEKYSDADEAAFDNSGLILP